MSDTILTDKTLTTSKDKNEKEKDKEKEKENGNENDETLMSSKDDDDDKNENENENENKDDDETMSQKEKNEIIKGKDDILDEIIDKSKSFEEQIKWLKRIEGLKGFWPYNDFGDKELKSKYLKIEFADMSSEIDKKLFKQIFDHTLIKLRDPNTQSTY